MLRLTCIWHSCQIALSNRNSPKFGKRPNGGLWFVVSDYLYPNACCTCVGDQAQWIHLKRTWKRVKKKRIVKGFHIWFAAFVWIIINRWCEHCIFSPSTKNKKRINHSNSFSFWWWSINERVYWIWQPIEIIQPNWWLMNGLSSVQRAHTHVHFGGKRPNNENK